MVHTAALWDIWKLEKKLSLLSGWSLERYLATLATHFPNAKNLGCTVPATSGGARALDIQAGRIQEATRGDHMTGWVMMLAALKSQNDVVGWESNGYM